MTRLTLTFGTALLCSLIGCTPPAAPLAAQSTARTVSVQGAVKVTTPGYKLAAVVKPNTALDIDTLEVMLDGNSHGFISPDAGGTYKLKFNNLKPDATYDVELIARNSLDEPISDEEGSHTELRTSAKSEGSSEDTIVDVTFNLKLSDKTFSTNTSSTVTVNSGALKNGVGDEGALTADEPASDAVQLPGL